MRRPWPQNQSGLSPSLCRSATPTMARLPRSLARRPSEAYRSSSSGPRTKTASITPSTAPISALAPCGPTRPRTRPWLRGLARPPHVCGCQHHLLLHVGGALGSPVIVAGLAQSGSSCIGTLAALNPSTGQVEWQTPLQGDIEGAVTEVPGIVAVGAGPAVDLLSSATGKMLFSYHRSEKIVTQRCRLRRAHWRVLGASDHRWQDASRGESRWSLASVLSMSNSLSGQIVPGPTGRCRRV